MSMQFEWLYYVTFLVGTTLMAGVYVAGLVVSLRRWHLGMAARFGAAGFGLLLFETALVPLLQFFGPMLYADDGSRTLQWMALFHSLAVLIGGAGTILVVLGLRQALIDYGRSRSVLHADEWPAERSGVSSDERLTRT